MRVVRPVCAVLLFLGFSVQLVRVVSAAPQNSEYKLAKKVTLGEEGRWDYFDVEQAMHRIFIPRETHVLVVDPDGKVLGDIKGFHGVHGIAFAPDLQRAFTSNIAGSVSVIDLDSLKVINEIKIPDREPDSILYDPASKRVFTFNEEPASDATAIDATTGKIVGNIKLLDKAETAQADGEGHLFVNIEDKSAMSEIDTNTLSILHTVSVAPCKTPTGLAIDVVHKRLFAGCRSGVAIVLDYTNGQIPASWPIGQGVDAMRFDPQTRLVFASCYDGTITVTHEDTPDTYTKVQTIQTELGARTMALDESSHTVFTVTSDFGPAPAPTQEEPRPRPAVISSTFRLLIYHQ